jgi:penicillin-insensitive murein DD-endopeptidase
MRSLAFCLALLFACGTVSAEMRPSFAGAASTAKPRPKAPAKKKAAPKGPPAKMLFGSITEPAPLAARAIGAYNKGCLAGGVALPINGPAWQVMRLSRNRNFGHPRLIAYLEKLAKEAREKDGWPGLLVGDLSQARGGPMLTGHTSHQIGLDADIWLTPMPDRILTKEEREDKIAVSMLKDPFSVDPAIWTPTHLKLIKRAASSPQLSRIFVHPAIKKALCEGAGKDRGWLGKVRPWWNHFYHFHVRLACPPGAAGCDNQKPTTGEDGCGKELEEWYKMLRSAALHAPVPPKPGAPPPKKKSPLTVADLPADCKTILNAGGVSIVSDGSAPAAMAAVASKDAGPPLPRLDPVALQVLKAQLSGKKPANFDPIPGTVPLPDRKPRL